MNAGHVSIGKVNLDGSHDDKGQNHDLMGLEASDYKIAPDEEETGDDNDKEPSPTKYQAIGLSAKKEGSQISNSTAN